MEGREKPQMHEYGKNKKTEFMMSTVLHVISSAGLRKFKADGYLFNRENIQLKICYKVLQEFYLSGYEV